MAMETVEDGVGEVEGMTEAEEDVVGGGDCVRRRIRL